MTFAIRTVFNAIVVLLVWIWTTGTSCGQVILKTSGQVNYDFTFVRSAIAFLEYGDSNYLYRISESDAARHIYNHAIRFNSGVPADSPLCLVKYLLSPAAEKKELLPYVEKTLQYAVDSIAGTGTVPSECLKYLPDGFQYRPSTCLYFTFGYDLGVVYGGNASINLANNHFLQDVRETRYYSVHELHHAGFVALKHDRMPGLEILTYQEMAVLIEFYTHMEGMAVYAAYDIRDREKALARDNDYAALGDTLLMKAYEKEYFDIYFHFKNSPETRLTVEDWDKLARLSNGNRLWYRVGALMAQRIDREMGRGKLVSLIEEPSEQFIGTYLSILKSN